MIRKKRYGRIIRICVSALVFVWIASLFLDIQALLPEGVFYPLRYLQIIPVLKLLLISGGLAIFVFALFLLSAALFGRIYCSFLCPLGALQDVLGFLRRRIGRKTRYHQAPGYPVWRYTFLALFLIFLFIGAGAWGGFLDPYSHFGRILSQLAINPVIFFNNLLSKGLSSMHIYSWPPLAYAPFQPLPFVFALSVFLLLVILVYRNGRIFCNTLCPVGSGLGLLSRLAPFHIYIDSEKCSLCGLCASVCKAGCMDLKTRTVDKSRCVMCFNCLPVCQEGGIFYGRKKPSLVQEFPGRRQFIKIVGAGAAMPLMAASSSAPVKHRNVAISPPGSGSHEQLHQACTACQLCVNACPSGVLQPAFMDYGWEGIMQPLLDPQMGYCRFDCIRCSEVCPTGALQVISLGEKHRLQLGKAKFLYDYCVVPLENKNCGACSEHCPTKAVDMVKWKGHLYLPEVNADLCVGCGACEYACPTIPLSIFVEGLKVHGLAKIPPSMKEEKVDHEVMEDFPF